LRVNPANGGLRVHDLSIDNAEHNPIVMTRKDRKFYVGTFGEDGGMSLRYSTRIFQPTRCRSSPCIRW
jgi:hypothetical protein